MRSIARNTSIYALTDKHFIIINVHRDGSITERDYRGDELIPSPAKNTRAAAPITFESARGGAPSDRQPPPVPGHRTRRSKFERMLRDQFGNC
ncbi:MAG: hypothetical protein R3B67_04400 [Phycisphaerales bacterium]